MICVQFLIHTSLGRLANVALVQVAHAQYRIFLNDPRAKPSLRQRMLTYFQYIQYALAGSLLIALW